jgi:prophage antirepressor-like protein
MAAPTIPLELFCINNVILDSWFKTIENGKPRIWVRATTLYDMLCYSDKNNQIPFRVSDENKKYYGELADEICGGTDTLDHPYSITRRTLFLAEEGVEEVLKGSRKTTALIYGEEIRILIAFLKKYNMHYLEDYCNYCTANGENIIKIQIYSNVFSYSIMDVPRVKAQIAGEVIEFNYLTFVNIDTGVNEVWVSSRELCKFLGYRNPADVVKHHVNDGHRSSFRQLYERHLKGLMFKAPLNWQLKTTFVSEYGVRQLLFRATRSEVTKYRKPILKLVITLRADHSLETYQEPLALELARNKRLINRINQSIKHLDWKLDRMLNGSIHTVVRST